MSRRNLSLQRRCSWWLNECLRLGWPKAQLPALEKLYWKYKPWRMAVKIGKALEDGGKDRQTSGGKHS